VTQKLNCKIIQAHIKHSQGKNHCQK